MQYSTGTVHGINVCVLSTVHHACHNLLLFEELFNWLLLYRLIDALIGHFNSNKRRMRLTKYTRIIVELLQSHGYLNGISYYGKLFFLMYMYETANVPVSLMFPWFSPDCFGGLLSGEFGAV